MLKPSTFFTEYTVMILHQKETAHKRINNPKKENYDVTLFA